MYNNALLITTQNGYPNHVQDLDKEEYKMEEDPGILGCDAVSF